MSIDIQMDSLNSLGLESQKNNDVDVEAFDEIIFKLVCTGNTRLAKKYTRNYLKNFYKTQVDQIE